MPTLHTEKGDVPLTGDESVLYHELAADRFRVFTNAELCRALDLRGRELDTLAARLRHKIQLTTGLRLIINVWGVGYRLEDRSA